MGTMSTVKKTDTISKLLICFIAIAASFWIIANTVDVYKYTALGVIFEIFWLPVILITFSIPILSIVCWYRKGYKISSPFLYVAIAALFLNIVMILS